MLKIKYKASASSTQLKTLILLKVSSETMIKKSMLRHSESLLILKIFPKASYDMYCTCTEKESWNRKKSNAAFGLFLEIVSMFKEESRTLYLL